MKHTWRNLLRGLLEWTGALRRTDLVAERTDEHPGPDELAGCRLIIVGAGSIDKWACFRCPGGCGQKIQLSLSPQQRPRWRVAVDWLGRPTIHPSVCQTNVCKCHFWVRAGRILWCSDSRHTLHGGSSNSLSRNSIRWPAHDVLRRSCITASGESHRNAQSHPIHERDLV